MGESTFQLWCANSGLVANGSKIDKTGWDFLVEFPVSALSADTALVHKASIECKVQVKATEKKNRKWAVKISNLKRLVATEIPAFFVFVEFDGMESAQRAFIVHVDEILMRKVLKKVHSINQSEKENKFN